MGTMDPNHNRKLLGVRTGDPESDWCLANTGPQSLQIGVDMRAGEKTAEVFKEIWSKEKYAESFDEVGAGQWQ